MAEGGNVDRWTTELAHRTSPRSSLSRLSLVAAPKRVKISVTPSSRFDEQTPYSQSNCAAKVFISFSVIRAGRSDLRPSRNSRGGVAPLWLVSSSFFHEVTDSNVAYSKWHESVSKRRRVCAGDAKWRTRSAKSKHKKQPSTRLKIGSFAVEIRCLSICPLQSHCSRNSIPRIRNDAVAKISPYWRTISKFTGFPSIESSRLAGSCSEKRWMIYLVNATSLFGLKMESFGENLELGVD